MTACLVYLSISTAHCDVPVGNTTIHQLFTCSIVKIWMHTHTDQRRAVRKPAVMRHWSEIRPCCPKRNSKLKYQEEVPLTWMAWSSTLCSTWRSMASRVGFCCGMGAGPGGGASPLSWVTVTSRKSWGAAGGAWPMDRFSTSSGLLLAGITDADTTAW